MLSITLHFLLGVVLGMRFRVFILLPAALLICCFHAALSFCKYAFLFNGLVDASLAIFVAQMGFVTSSIGASVASGNAWQRLPTAGRSTINL